MASPLISAVSTDTGQNASDMINAPRLASAAAPRSSRRAEVSTVAAARRSASVE